jgi:hypothetical protein
MKHIYYNMALQNHQTVLTRQSFHKASCKVNPSVTGYIFVAVALLTYLRLLQSSSHHKIHYIPATVAESEMRPEFQNLSSC